MSSRSPNTSSHTARLTGLALAAAMAALPGCPLEHAPGDDAGTQAGRCGDDRVDGLELCDGADLAGESCESLGFGSGALACAEGCRDFDRSACGAPPSCGDDQRQPPELCDGIDLAGETCESLGQAAGTLLCALGCGGFDTSGCGQQSRCGDGTVDSAADEQCEPGLAISATCADYGLALGSLSCDQDCHIDASACRDPVCGDAQIEHLEQCDDANALAGDGCDAACQLEPYAFCWGLPSVCIVGGDHCEQAIELSSGAVSFPRAEFTDSYGPYQGLCGFDQPGAGPDAVFSLSAPARSVITVTVSGAAASGALLVLSPDCPALEQGCVAYAPGRSASYTNDGGAAAQLYVVVDGLSGASSAMFELQVDVHSVVCGDGLIELDEACDDGDRDAGDGCSASCSVEPDHRCFGEPSLCFAGGESCEAPIDIGAGSLQLDTALFADDIDSYGSCHSACSAICTSGMGEDVVFRTAVPAAHLLSVSFSAGVDVAVSRACQDFTASCLAGSRQQQVSYFNSSDADEEVFIIVDADDYSTGSSVFDLDVALVDLSTPSDGESCDVAIALDAGTYDGNTAGYQDLSSNVYATCCEAPCAGFGVSLIGPDVFHRVSVPAGQTLTATLMAQATELSMWLALDCHAIGSTCTERLWVEAGSQGELSYSNTGQAPVDVFLIVDSDDAANAGAYRIIVDLAS